MVGRKPLIAPFELIEAVMKFKEKVITDDEDGNKRVAVATNPVWHDISCFLNGRMSSAAIHTSVHRGSHGMKEKLGIFSCKNDVETITPEENRTYYDDGESSECNSDITLPSITFVFTFSPEEWQSIQPGEIRYKNTDKKHPSQSSRVYFVMPKNEWTPVLAEHFWDHTHLQCCISFHRAKVYPNGNFYLKVTGKCTSCESYFEGIVFERPPATSRVLMHCSYTGNFNEVHKIKKRRMIGPAQSKALIAMLNDGLSSETFREREAVRLIQIGKNDPSIIPTGNALRLLKSRKNSDDKRHKDAFTAICMMKNENEYKDVLRHIGFDPFFIHYYNPEQIHMYRKYCSSVPYPQLIIDATGSIVKSFTKYGSEKTKTIFLYEAIVHDQNKSHSFTVTNMLSESHNTISIYNWLANWMASNVPPPKQVVSDQSLALLSAIVKAFTQYSSLKSYINACADIITERLPKDPRWLPHCYIKLDIAHFMKLISQWPPLKLLSRKVREIILRTIGRFVRCQNLEDMYALLLSLFIVITNESNGIRKDSRIETPCEMHLKRLLNVASTGIIELDQQLDDIIDCAGIEDDTHRLLAEEVPSNQFECLEEINPFKKLAEKVYEESKSYIQEGTGINPLYAPKLIPYIVQMMQLLPLWSGVMVPSFGYGEVISSSAAVESSFNKLKNNTFKHIILPTDIEKFLETHILSLRGASLLKSTEISQSNSINEEETYSREDVELQYTNKNINVSRCPLCKSGSLPSKNGVHKCSICRTPVHALPECSANEPNEDDIRYCFNCFEAKEKSTEDNAIDKWNRKSKKQLKSSYIIPNPHLRHVNLNNLQNSPSLPLLKNGSRADELKSCTLKNMDKSVILSNTCAFDAIASLLMVSFCDSQLYSCGLLQNKTEFIDFISKLVTNGINSKTYVERAELIIAFLKPNLQTLQYNTILISCDTTPKTIFKKMLNEFPTIKEISKCFNNSCIKYQKTSENICFITYCTSNYAIDGLQNFLDERLLAEKKKCNVINDSNNSPCTSDRKTEYELSPLHVMIEILYWEGENMERTGEAVPIINIKLSDIPLTLKYKETIYNLRGLLNYKQGKSNLRNSIGHYSAYVRREAGHWELYDDMRKKPVPIKNSTIVSSEVLMYTI